MMMSKKKAVVLVLALMVFMANSVSCNDVSNINIGHVGLDLQQQDDGLAPIAGGGEEYHCQGHQCNYLRQDCKSGCWCMPGGPWMDTCIGYCC